MPNLNHVIAYSDLDAEYVQKIFVDGVYWGSRVRDIDCEHLWYFAFAAPCAMSDDNCSSRTVSVMLDEQSSDYIMTVNQLIEMSKAVAPPF
jgi:hypothetical protein